MRRVKRDLGAINPRFRSPDHTKRINFTKRTLERLFASWRFGLLDETHLRHLLGGYARQTHRELELTRAGLIYHPEAQVPLRAVCTNISWITALTNKGADILASKGYRIDVTRHRERYRRHKAFNAILHDLNRSDFLVGLDRAARLSPSITLDHQDALFGQPYTETISFASMVVWKREHWPVTIEPDGLFSLSFDHLPPGRRQKYFALEIDRDTESNVRYTRFREQKSILKTMIAYAEAGRRGIVQDRLALPNLRVIFVTTTERHIDNILADAATHYIAKGYPANAVLFVSREKLQKFDPMSVEYCNAAGGRVLLTEWA